MTTDKSYKWYFKIELRTEHAMVLCSPIFQGMCFEKKGCVISCIVCMFCMYVWVYVCMYVCMYTYMYVPASRQLCSTGRVILEITQGISE